MLSGIGLTFAMAWHPAHAPCSKHRGSVRIIAQQAKLGSCLPTLHGQTVKRFCNFSKSARLHRCAKTVLLGGRGEYGGVGTGHDTMPSSMKVFIAKHATWRCHVHVCSCICKLACAIYLPARRIVPVFPLPFTDDLHYISVALCSKFLLM